MFIVNQQNNIENFKFYLLWGDKNRRPLDALKKDDVILAVNKAYIDMQPRTIDGLGLKLDRIKMRRMKIRSIGI